MTEDRQARRLERALAGIPEERRQKILARSAQLKAEWDALTPEERAERSRPKPDEVIFHTIFKQWEEPKDAMFYLTICEFADEIIDDLKTAGYEIVRCSGND